MSNDGNLLNLAQQLGATLQQYNLTLTTAESCTGGWIAQMITAIPGSSAWFERGFITYSNRAKQEMLGVAKQTLQEQGAVSSEVVTEMTQGALRRSHAEVAIAISGIAGPDGGSQEKPVGLVWIAWANKRLCQTEKKYFSGSRTSIREQAVQVALAGMLDFLNDNYDALSM